MREAHALWPTFVCPCGVQDCKPTVEDLARDLWAQSIVGSRPSADRTLFVAPKVAPRAEPVELSEVMECPGCGGDVVLFAYLAATLRLRGARPPKCAECQNPTPTPQQAWWDK